MTQEHTISPQENISSETKLSGQIVTFGCRLNTYESEVIRGFIRETSDPENTIVFNTCAVTAEAERQARQAIRKARRENPHARIIVTGCAAQINPATYAEMPEVDRVLGNEEKLQAHSYEFSLETPKVAVNDIMSIQETALHLISGFEEHVRAFIQVQNGCNHRCTFCRIPYGRGNSRSVAMGEIVQVCEHLVKRGYQEIVLTGVDITDYGLDLPGQPKLGQMVRRLLTLVPGIQRLRLSSLDPVEMDEELIELIVKEPRVLPHIHLSVQAGDNLTLKRMKRRHLREDVIAICHRLRTQRPELVFGADLIAGFPTETEEMFQNTLKLIEECNLTFLHVFPYSAHKETPAARMPQVPSHTIKERAARLREKAADQLNHYLKNRLGYHEAVLLEKEDFGHTQSFANAKVVGGGKPGEIVQTKVVGLSGTHLVCERV